MAGVIVGAVILCYIVFAVKRVYRQKKERQNRCLNCPYHASGFCTK